MKNVMRILSVVVLSAGLMAVTAHAADTGIQAGKWQVTTVTKVKGMDEEFKAAKEQMEKMPPAEKAKMDKMMGTMGVHMDNAANALTTTATQCMSSKDPVPNISINQKCHVTHKKDGNTVHFKVTCPDSDATGTVHYQGKMMKGTVHSKQIVKDKVAEVTMQLSGKYLGPCTQ